MTEQAEVMQGFLVSWSVLPRLLLFDLERSLHVMREQ